MQLVLEVMEETGFMELQELVDEVVAVMEAVVLAVQAVLAVHLEQELNHLKTEVAHHLVDLVVAVQAIQDLKGNMAEEAGLALNVQMEILEQVANQDSMVQ